MPEGLSLRFRLNLMIVLTMLLILGMGFLFAVHNARRSVLDEIHSTANLALQLIEAGYGQTHAGGRPLAEWLEQLRRLDQTRHLRIQIRQAPATLIDLASRDGESGVDVPAWFLWSVAPPPVVVERRLDIGNDGEIGLRIEAKADDEIAEAWNETRGFLTLLLILAGTVYLLVNVTIGRAFRSVGAILEGMEQIEKGEYGRRLPIFPLPEFARIARAFNHMAETLERARDENRALARQSLAIQEEERRSLARELHDEMGQSLTAIKAMAASLRAPELAREPVEQILAICDHLFGVMRGMLQRLRPIVLDELGLSASLEDLVENWRARNPGIRLDFHCEEAVDECSGTARIHLFRIVQEALTNVVKHAAATQARVDLQVREEANGREWIVLEIGDNGCGCGPETPRRGLGLPGIRERVAGLGGEFSLHTRPGAGLRIEVRVPCGLAEGTSPPGPRELLHTSRV